MFIGEMLFSNLFFFFKEWATNIYYNLDESQGNFIK